MTNDFERAATHEVGHVTVALSLGLEVDDISRYDASEIPEPLLALDFEDAVAVMVTSG
jgi:hypothetical protein